MSGTSIGPGEKNNGGTFILETWELQAAVQKSEWKEKCTVWYEFIAPCYRLSVSAEDGLTQNAPFWCKSVQGPDLHNETKSSVWNAYITGCTWSEICSHFLNLFFPVIYLFVYKARWDEWDCCRCLPLLGGGVCIDRAVFQGDNKRCIFIQLSSTKNSCRPRSRERTQDASDANLGHFYPLSFHTVLGLAYVWLCLYVCVCISVYGYVCVGVSVCMRVYFCVF